MNNNIIYYEGIDMNEIIAEYWKTVPGGEPQWNIPNQRNNKIYNLMVNLRDMVERNPETLRQLVPTYGLSEAEYEGVLKSVLKTDGAPRVTQRMQMIVNELKSKKLMESGKTTLPEKIFDELNQKGLPDGYKQCLIGVPEKDRFNAFICITSAMTPFVDHLKYRYADNNPDRCNLQVLVYGPAGCGKSVFSNAIKPLTDILKEADGKELKKLTDYKKIKSKKERENTPKPTPLLRYGFADVTAAGLKELVYNANGRNIFITTNEMSRMNCDEVADILRLGYDDQDLDAYRVTEDSVTGRDVANISCVLLGTEDQARNFCFGGSRGQNGTADRIIPCQFVEGDDDENIPWYESRNEDDERLIREAVEKLETPIAGELDLADIQFALRQWVAEKNKIIKTLPGDEKKIVRILRNRSAKNGYRAAIPYLLLSGDKEQASKVAIMVAEFCFQQRYRIMKSWAPETSFTVKPSDVSIAEAKACPNNDDLLKSQLGEYFTYADLSAVYGGSSEAARAQVKRWRGREWVAPAGKDGKFSRFKNLLYVHQ